MKTARAQIILAVAFIIVPIATAHAAAQAHPRGIEIGAAVGAINLSQSVREKPLTSSLRAGYRFAPAFGIETEVTIGHEDPSGNFGQTMWVAGPKLGLRISRVNILGSVRAGAIRFGGRAFRAFNGDVRVEPAINIGGMIELDVARHVAVRVDAGTTIIPFGSPPLRGPLPPYVRNPGTTSNGTGTVGVQVRF